jgi:hypothetical protein
VRVPKDEREFDRWLGRRRPGDASHSRMRGDGDRSDDADPGDYESSAHRPEAEDRDASRGPWRLLLPRDGSPRVEPHRGHVPAIVGRVCIYENEDAARNALKEHQ